MTLAKVVAHWTCVMAQPSSDVVATENFEPFNLFDTGLRDLLNASFEVVNVRGIPPSKHVLRYYFLDGIKKFLPAVMDDLAGEPFSLFMKSGLSRIPFWRVVTDIMKLVGDPVATRIYAESYAQAEPNSEESAIVQSREFKTYAEALAKWTDTRKIYAPWILLAVWHTHRYWAREERYFESREWFKYFPRTMNCLTEPKDMTTLREPFNEGEGGVLPYFPALESSEQFESRVSKLIEDWTKHPVALLVPGSNIAVDKTQAHQSIRAYRQRVEAHAKASGLSVIKRSNNLQRDIEWAVRFQVGRSRPHSIWKQYNEAHRDRVSLPTIRTAIARILSAIDLPKRGATQTGRPREE